MTSRRAGLQLTQIRLLSLRSAQDQFLEESLCEMPKVHTVAKDHMARFASSGSAIASPLRDEAELRRVLAELGVSDTFDNGAIHEIYLSLSVIIGEWLSDQERVEVDPVAKTLLRMAKNLSEVSQLMCGFETGFQNSFETAVASQLARYLALEPTVAGSSGKAQELMSSFRREAAQVGHVCMVGYVDLSQKVGQQGRLALAWYDDFTALLLEVAAKAGVEPKNSKNRSTGIRGGWLIDAAMALETFFYREMRSPSAEACGKRLERSRKRLKAVARQKPSPR
jgi:hypothetical protein